MSKIKEEIMTSQNVSQNKGLQLKGTGGSHIGGGTRTSMHGYANQYSILMIFMQRALRLKHDFMIATEHDLAYAFDDLVFRYEKNGFHYRFLQAKHKQTKGTLTKTDLLNDKGDDFSVRKYYESYRKIKTEQNQTFKGVFDDFVLSTNHQVDEELLKNFDDSVDKNFDSLLSHPESAIDKKDKPMRYILVKNSELYDELASKLKDTDNNYILILKLLGKYAANNNITIDKIIWENRDWLMQNIFDESSMKQVGSKFCLKFRSSFLKPTTTFMRQYSEVFFEAYYITKKRVSENTFEVTDEQKEEIRNTLEYTYFGIGRKFVFKEAGRDKNISLADDEVDWFLSRLIFAVNQPCDDKLMTIVKQEVGEYLQLLDSELAIGAFRSCILDWSKTRHGTFATRTDLERLFSNIEVRFAVVRFSGLTANYKSIIENFGCTFDKSNVDGTLNKMINFFNAKDENILITYYSNRLLTEIKYMQIKKDSKIDEYIVSELESCINLVDSKMCPLKVFSTNSCVHFIIIFTNEKELSIKSLDLIEKLLNVVKIDNRKLSFIVPVEMKTNFDKYMLNLFESVKPTYIYDISNCFEDLDSNSQNVLLSETVVEFRGCKTRLNNIFDTDDLKCLTEGNLSDAIRRNLTLQAPEKTDKYDKVKKYYRDRHIFRGVKISKKIFSDDSFLVFEKKIDIYKDTSQEIVLISDSHDIYKEVCTKFCHNCVHWVMWEGNELLWKASSSSVQNLRKHVIENQNNEGNSKMTEETLSDDSTNSGYSYSGTDESSSLESSQEHKKYFKIKINNVFNLNERIIIISASPGMGKSIMFSHIASQSKFLPDLKEFCILKINFKDYFVHFNEMSTKNVTILETIKFLYLVMFIKSEDQSKSVTKSVLKNVINSLNVLSDGKLNILRDKIKTGADLLNLKLFTYLYNDGKIVLLLDGFDEIVPLYKVKVFCLLKTLITSRIHKLWLSTRPYNIKEELENVCGTFSYNLMPLSSPEQKYFLQEYWKNRLNINNITFREVDLFLRYNLPSLFWYINTSGSQNIMSVFMGIPQHIKMIAKIYEDKFLEFYQDDDYDKYELIDIFLSEVENEEGINIYDLYTNFFEIKLQKSKKINKLDPSQQDEYISLVELQVKLYGELGLLELYGTDLPDVLLVEVKRSKIENSSLLEKVDYERPQFVHRTYAEYFAGRALAVALLPQTNVEKRHAAKQVLYQLLTDSEGTGVSLFTFFNYYIASISEHSNIFKSALRNGIPLSLLIEYRHLHDVLGRTPIHLLYSSLITGSFKFYLLHEESDTFNFIEDNLFQWTPLHYITICHNCYFSERIFNDVRKIHKTKKDALDENGLTPYMLAAKKGCNHNCVDVYLISAPLDIDCIGVDGKTALHFALAQKYGGISFACRLIKMGANLFIKDSDGVEPIDLIISKKNKTILATVISTLSIRDTVDFKLFCVKYLIPDANMCAHLLSKDPKTALALLKTDVMDVNVKDYDGNTPLHLVFQNFRNIATLLHLIKFKADIYSTNNEGKLPGYYDKDKAMACFLDGYDFKTFSLLDEAIKRNIDILTPFLLTLDFSDNDIVVHVLSRYKNISNKLLVNHKVDLNVKDSQGKNALHHSVLNMSLSNVIYLLSKGINVIAQDNDGRTALEYLPKDLSSQEPVGQKIFMSLIRFGAYHDVPFDGAYESCDLIIAIRKLFTCVQSNKVDELETFFKTCNDIELVVNARSKQHGCPIHCAVKNGQPIIVKKLLSYGSFYNSPGINDELPEKITKDKEILKVFELLQQFFEAIQKDDGEEVKRCLESGAIINAGFKNNTAFFYPLHLAVSKNNIDMVEILLKEGASVNLKAYENQNMLHIACRGPKNMLELILKHLNQETLVNCLLHEDLFARTPLYYAIVRDDIEFLSILLESCGFMVELPNRDDIFKVFRVTCYLAKRFNSKNVGDKLLEFTQKLNPGSIIFFGLNV